MPRFRPNSTLGIRLALDHGQRGKLAQHPSLGRQGVGSGGPGRHGGSPAAHSGRGAADAGGRSSGDRPATLYSYLYYRKQRKAGAPALTVQLKTRWAVFLVALAAVLLVGLFVTGSVSVSFDGSAMTIDADGWNDMTLPYSSIASVQYLPEGQAPEAGCAPMGFGNQKVSLGNFHNNAYGD